MDQNTGDIVRALRDYASLLEQIENAKRVQSLTVGVKQVRLTLSGSTDTAIGVCGGGLPKAPDDTRMNGGASAGAVNTIIKEVVLDLETRCCEARRRLDELMP